MERLSEVQAQIEEMKEKEVEEQRALDELEQ